MFYDKNDDIFKFNFLFIKIKAINSFFYVGLTAKNIVFCSTILLHAT